MNIQVNVFETMDGVKGQIGGEIDAFTAPVLREHLSSIELSNGMYVELNLSDITYMDSTGLGVFVAFYKSVNANNGHLKLVGLSDRLSRLFEITGLSEIMDIQIEQKGGTAS